MIHYKKDNNLAVCGASGLRVYLTKIKDIVTCQDCIKIIDADNVSMKRKIDGLNRRIKNQRKNYK